MGGFYVHGRQRDFLLTDDLATLYGPPATKIETTDVSDYYNRPEPRRLNRKERRTEAAKARKKLT